MFVFLVVFILVMLLFGLLKNDVEWAVFPGFGIILGMFFHISLLTDGSLTQVSGGTTTPIASASTALSSSWLAIQWVPLMLTVMCFFIVVYRVGVALK